MSRGKKLDIFIGANIQEGWREIGQSQSKRDVPVKRACEHALKFFKEKRRGKTVTVVGEFYISDKELKQILKEIKSEFGCGGTCKEGHMYFQGDILEPLKSKFKELGFN